MATPQWILVQRRLEPSKKSDETQFEKNARRRQKEAVKSALKKGVIRTLDVNLITLISSNLQDIEYISFPSMSIHSIDHLAILSCPQLCIINLPFNYISDITPLHSCIHLIKLDLSGNQIQVLPDAKFWSGLISLKILYINGNLIANKECILKLSGCPQLQVLTLYDTPVSLLSNYRHIAANCIMTLKALDNHVISDEEIIENLHLSGKFRALARSFYKLLYLPVHKSDDFNSEMKRIYSLLLMVDTVQSHCNPVIIIQRWIKGWLTRKRLAHHTDPKISALVRKRTNEETSLILREGVSRNDMYLKQTNTVPPPSPANSDATHPIEQDSTKMTGDNLKKGAKKGKKKKLKANVNENELIVKGEHQSIEEINKMKEVKQFVENVSQDIRQAKKEIATIINEKKQPPELDYSKYRPEVSKDTYNFIRGHATMALSTLKALEEDFKSNKKANDLALKADTVAKIKQEREIRRDRILEHQQMIKEMALNWRAEKDTHLEKERVKLERKEDEEHVKRINDVENAAEKTRKLLDKQKFNATFTQVHCKVEKMLMQEKRRIQKERETESIQRFVQNLKETESERQEIVKRFMGLRQEKLKKDIAASKYEFNTRISQAVSEQQKEVKLKVKREKMRKLNASQQAPLDIEVPRQDLSEALVSIPEASGGIDTNELVKSLLSKPGSSRGPFGGFESARTWQRGYHAVQGKPHFPEILRVKEEESPLMYNMYRPLPHWQTVDNTPFYTSVTNTTIHTPVDHFYL